MFLKNLIDPDWQKLLPAEWLNRDISAVCSDSRQVKPGSLFIAQQGAGAHGGTFIEDAIRRGAAVVVSDAVAKAAKLFDAGNGILKLSVDDAHKFLIDTAKNFYGDPAARVRTIGITGTNGKTTTTYLLESIFAAAGKTGGVIGTVQHRCGKTVWPAHNTTPGLVENYSLLAAMASEGASHCFMEVSSHALSQGRVDGLRFAQAVFTNLTSDHLDYHKNREEYFLAKAKLFTTLDRSATAIINVDDPFANRLLGMTKSAVLTFGLKNRASVTASQIRMTLEGTQFQLVLPSGKIDVQTRLVGNHNIANILAAAAVSCVEGLPAKTIKKGIENLTKVPGRLESVEVGQDFFVFVDYAHTEDALRNVLSSLRKVSSSKIILVFGCGGDRDRTKRPLMGRAAVELADEVIITSDNPRSEDPRQIIAEIEAGCSAKKYQVILDRRQAVTAALDMARAGEMVLIAGKGHEDYQIFQDKTIAFDERLIVREYLEQKVSQRL